MKNTIITLLLMLIINCNSIIASGPCDGPPKIICPPDISVECPADIDDVQLLGYPTVLNSCGEKLKVGYEDQIISASCDEKTIERLWYYYDETGAIFKACYQRITFKAGDDLIEDDITWPEDMTVYSCDYLPEDLGLNEGVGEPEISTGLCLTRYVSHFDNIEKHCEDHHTITRVWYVLDWCTGELFQSTQTIELICPKLPNIYCHETINISIADYGYATFLPEYAYEGHYEDCGAELNFSVSIDGELYLDTLDFDCNDLGWHTMLLQVEYGNETSIVCKLDVLVEDKIGACEKKHNGNTETDFRSSSSRSNNASIARVYPNPVHETLQIEMDVKQNATAYIHIMDNKGKLIQSIDHLETGPQLLNIDVSTIVSNSTILILAINDGENLMYKKITVFR